VIKHTSIYLLLLVYHKSIGQLACVISMKTSYVYLSHENGTQQLYRMLIITTVYRIFTYIYTHTQYKICIIIPHHIAGIAPFPNTYQYKYIYIYTYIHTYTYIYIYIYTHTQRRFLNHIMYIHSFKLIQYWRLKPSAVTQCHVLSNTAIRTAKSHTMYSWKRTPLQRDFCTYHSASKVKTESSKEKKERHASLHSYSKQFHMGCWKNTQAIFYLAFFNITYISTFLHPTHKWCKSNSSNFLDIWDLHSFGMLCSVDW
jgi:hypothetical protein